MNYRFPNSLFLRVVQFALDFTGVARHVNLLKIPPTTTTKITRSIKTKSKNVNSLRVFRLGIRFKTFRQIVYARINKWKRVCAWSSMFACACAYACVYPFTLFNLIFKMQSQIKIAKKLIVRVNKIFRVFNLCISGPLNQSPTKLNRSECMSWYFSLRQTVHLLCPNFEIAKSNSFFGIS